MDCRHCKTFLTKTFIDLGFAPPSNAYLKESGLSCPETFYPLKVLVCDKCWLVQTEDYNNEDDLFTDDYAYFSSTSKSFLKHAKDFVDKIVETLKLTSSSYVIEIASNDGYLLKNFLERGIPCLGIEPTASTANASREIGVKVIQKFFSESLANDLTKNNKKADLIIGNNVFAHVPNINDFTIGMKKCLKQNGTITLEFPHLLNLIQFNQFDTIYHEHFSYLSLKTVSKIFEKYNLKVFDVEKLETHGGSLRVYGAHSNDSRKVQDSVKELLLEEKNNRLDKISTYQEFQLKADEVKNRLLEFLLEQKRKGKSVLAYGAAAKGNTILNYAGIKSDLIELVADAAISKQNKFMPGSHIPIVSPKSLKDKKFDYLLILPWNIAEEVHLQLKDQIDPNVKFVTAIPALKIT